MNEDEEFSREIDDLADAFQKLANGKKSNVVLNAVHTFIMKNLMLCSIKLSREAADMTLERFTNGLIQNWKHIKDEDKNE